MLCGGVPFVRRAISKAKFLVRSRTADRGVAPPTNAVFTTVLG
jgi:hypothetical protein